MKICLNTMTFLLHYPLYQAIERASQLGFESVEICGDRPHGWPQDLSKKDRRCLHELSKSLNVKTESVCTGLVFYSQPGFAHWKEKVRDEGVRYVKGLIGLASDLEARIVTVVPGRALLGSSPEDSWSWVVENLSKCAHYAEDRNLTLSLENQVNPTEFLDNPINMMKMIKDINAENLGVTLDLGHVNVVRGSLSEFTDDLRKLIVNVHVNDNDGKSDLHLKPGDGNIDFGVAIGTLRDMGYNGCLTLEIGAGWHWDRNDADRTVAESKKSLENIVGN